MLTALAILAVIEAAPSSRVELTLTGVNSAPVSAAPRSLSDVARERREGQKGVGSFSAVETTVPRNLGEVQPAFDWEESETAPEPEVVTGPQPPTYVQTYLPTSYGGRPTRAQMRRHPTSRPAAPQPEQGRVNSPLAQPVFQARPAAPGQFRQRPG